MRTLIGPIVGSYWETISDESGLHENFTRAVHLSSHRQRRTIPEREKSQHRVISSMNVNPASGSSFSISFPIDYGQPPTLAQDDRPWSPNNDFNSSPILHLVFRQYLYHHRSGRNGGFRGFSVAPLAPMGAFRVIIKTFVSTIIHLEFAKWTYCGLLDLECDYFYY
jgi:hypothetical protein